MPSPTIQSAVEKLAREMGSWGAIELRVRREFEPLPSRTYFTRDGPTVDRLHYIESSGRTRLETRARTPEHPQATLVSIEFTRGPDGDSIFFIEEGGRSSRESVRNGPPKRPGGEFEGVLERPEPLCYFHFGTRPLHEALPEATLVGEARVLDRDCDGFQLIPTPPLNATPPHFVYWLDRETGIPLRFDYLIAAEGPSHRLVYTWTAESLDQVSGRHLPLTSSLSVYDSTAREQAAPRLDRRLIVEQVDFDREYPESTFRPAPAQDAYLVGTATEPPTPSPIRAAYPEPDAGMGDALANGLWAVCLVIAVAIVLAVLRSFRRWRGMRKQPFDDAFGSLG